MDAVLRIMGLYAWHNLLRWLSRRILRFWGCKLPLTVVGAMRVLVRIRFDNTIRTTFHFALHVALTGHAILLNFWRWSSGGNCVKNGCQYIKGHCPGPEGCQCRVSFIADDRYSVLCLGSGPGPSEEFSIILCFPLPLSGQLKDGAFGSPIRLQCVCKCYQVDLAVG